MPDELTARERNALKVAYLTSVHGMSQEQIRAVLGVSTQSEVSRLLAVATKSNWLRQSMSWPEALSHEEMCEMIDDLEKYNVGSRTRLEYLIRRESMERGGIQPQLHIVFSTMTTTPDGKPADTFGELAAQYVRPFLERAPNCAVAWGQTIGALVAATQRTEKAHDVQLFPVSGEPLNNRDAGISPSGAATKLAKALNAPAPPSLDGVPARIPKDLGPEGEAAMRLFARHSRDYQRIFGPRGLMEVASMILTGVGDSETSAAARDPWFLEAVQMETLDNLQETTIGNVGGVWMARQPGNADHEAAVEGINSRWLGIKEEHLRGCALRASIGRSPPGVFVIANGDKKAAIVERAIGLANHLVISRELASALLQRLEAKGGAARDA